MNLAKLGFNLAKPLLRCLDAELAHGLTIKVLKAGLGGAAPSLPRIPISRFGLSFENPLGLAAGFDKNAEAPDALLAHGVALTSTLAVYELFVPGRARISDPVLEAMSPAAGAAARAELDDLNAGKAFAVPVELFRKMMRFERRWVDAGGLLAAGVDPWGNGSLPGYGDHRNFEILVEAGFSPVEAIQIMSANGAKVLGQVGDLGTVSVGKRADLVVLDGNPAAVSSDIRRVRWVFKDGIGYDSGKLVRSVKGMVGVQ